jgi:hypothetical protein
MARPFAYLVFDGERLTTDTAAEGRRMRIDSRCLEGAPVEGAYAHVCALTDGDAQLPYDEPEVQGVRRDAMAWWIPLLGDSFVCLSSLATDVVHYAGAITVARDPTRFAEDPFARLFEGTTVKTDLFSAVPPPAGPVVERYAGAPWPAGSFAAAG